MSYFLHRNIVVNAGTPESRFNAMTSMRTNNRKKINDVGSKMSECFLDISGFDQEVDTVDKGKH